MRASEFITEGSKVDQDKIDLVKMAWNDGKKPKAIATDLGLTIDSVRHILSMFYQSRPGKLLRLASALTDQDKNDIVTRFFNNDTNNNISTDYSISSNTIMYILKSKLGIDRYNDEIERRKLASGVNIPNKITPEMLAKMRELYAAGKQLNHIADYFDNVIRRTSVSAAMKRQPDYAELRAKRDENTRKVKHEPVAATKIHRPGVIDPQGVHGPNSRQRSGVDWPKYG